MHRNREQVSIDEGGKTGIKGGRKCIKESDMELKIHEQGIMGKKVGDLLL